MRPIFSPAAERAWDQAELGDLVTGRRRGRSNAEEIAIFDSSGTGIQDVAAAARAFELARARGVGTRFELS
jgi:ornithine cyclodeaminase/alanine dehydrogenase-like protein (mu-crystallin family)